jgi:hypothetical protein
MNPQQQNNSKFFLAGLITAILAMFAVKEYKKRKQNNWNHPK